MPRLEPIKPSKPQGGAGRVFIIVGVSAVALAALFSLKTKPAAPPAPQSRAQNAAGESGFVGHYGYVVRLPAEYKAVQGFKDERKTLEVVHFCKMGTDPTNFLNEGLYGQLGIVRLEVQPSAYAGSLQGLDALTRLLAYRSQQRGEKYTLKNLQFSSLRGIQFTYDVPFPRVEAYILGDKVLYSFLAGQEDEAYRDILLSLRDSHSES